MTDQIQVENVDRVYDPEDKYAELPDGLKEYVAKLVLDAYHIDSIIVASERTVHVRSLGGFDPDVFNLANECDVMVASTSDVQVVVTSNE